MSVDQHHPDTGIPAQTGITVRLVPEFAKSLSTNLQSAPTSGSQPPTQRAGLLFGTIENDLITVQAFRRFAFWDALQSNSPSTDAELSGLELIGWCCARDGGTELLPREVQFHNRHFPRSTDLTLILNAERERGLLLELFARTSNAALSMQHFCLGSLHLSAETPITEPIDVHLEEKNNGDDLAGSQPAAPDISTLPANTIALLPGAPSRKTNGLLWLVSAALCVLAIGMTFAWAHARRQYLALTRDSQSVIGRIPPTSGLRMQAEGSGGGVVLSWNHNAPALRAAKQGILHIHDGSTQRTIYLDPSDLANGSIVYRPESIEARFRLELLGDHGSPLSNDVQAFGGMKSTIATDSPKTAVDAPGVIQTPNHTNRETHESAPVRTAAVSAGPETAANYVPARALKQPLPDTKLFAVPDIPEGAEVDVQVRIDENGVVIEARVKNGIKDNDLLRSAALEAAKQWIFEPAKIGGKNVASEHLIAFQFHP